MVTMSATNSLSKRTLSLSLFYHPRSGICPCAPCNDTFVVAPPPPVTSKDRSYPWVLAWLTRQAAGGRSLAGFGSTLAQHVSVSTSVGGGSSGFGAGSGLDTTGGGGGGGSTSGSTSSTGSSSSSGGGGASGGDVQFDFAPCPGRHFVSYGGRMLMVERSRAEQAMLDMNTGMPFETVKVTTLGRSRAVFESLLREAAAEAAEAERRHTVVFKSWGSEWHPFGKPRLRRPLSSVILDTGVAEGIVKVRRL